MGDFFTIEELEEYVAESDVLETKGLLVNTFEIGGTLAYKLLNYDDIRTKYGNKTVNTFDGLVKTLCKITDYEKTVIEIVQETCNVSYQQAVSKIAIAWNIRAKDGKGHWFKEQLETISHNRAILADPDSIKDKYPLLYKQIKNASRTRKYYDFICDLFMTQLEASGMFYLGCDKPLIASASKKFIAKAKGVGVNAAEDNINNLCRFGLIKKLTDEEVMEINVTHYEKVMKLRVKGHRTIASYQIIKWTDEVLAEAEHHIQYGKESGMTNKSQCGKSFEEHGYDTISKGSNELSKDDAITFVKLEKWARNKFRSDKACITNKEWAQKFNEFEKQTFGPQRACKSDRLRTLLIAKLDLMLIPASKPNRALFGGINSTKFKDIAYNSKMLVKRNRYEELTKDEPDKA